jgi:hypothetical protein
MIYILDYIIQIIFLYKNLLLKFMKQQYVNNNNYEILTPNGWEDFKGLLFNENANKESKKICFDNDEIVIATLEHRFYTNGNEVRVSDLSVGDFLDSEDGIKEIKSISDLILSDTYEIVDATNHKICINNIGLHSHQCDELSFVPPTIALEMWSSISPTLSTGGKAIITSTPNTDEDLFATIWKSANDRYDEYGNETIVGKNGFYAFSSHWSDHPDRDEAWALSERGKIGDAKFDREFECKFVTYEETLINPVTLSMMSGDNPMMNMGQTRWYKELSKDKLYAISLDPSLGTGGNNAAIEVFELPTFEQVAEWHHNLTPIQGQIKVLKELLIYIRDTIGSENVNNIYWSIENNTVGEAGLVCIKEIGEENLPGLFLSEPVKKGHVRKNRKGFQTTHRSKINAAARLKYLIESNKMKIRSKPLISELKTYIATGVSFKAKYGEEDDLVSALLLIVRMSQVLSDWDATVFESFSTKEQYMESDFDYPMPIYITTY